MSSETTHLTTHLKIIFAGSVGAGKSTSIQAVSDIAVISTEEMVSDELSLRKELTTVAMDYGQVNLDDGTKIHLYGAPGQHRFDFMWEILAQGALGVIVLIDDTSAAPLEEVEKYLRVFKKQIENKTLVVGITRTDLNPRHDFEAYRHLIAEYDRTMPLFTVDARDQKQIKTLARTLLYRIDPWLS